MLGYRLRVKVIRLRVSIPIYMLVYIVPIEYARNLLYGKGDVK